MPNKTGIVLEIKNKKACILTSEGEFAKVKIIGDSPLIGSTYTGLLESKLPFHKYIAAAACFILFISLGSTAYAYYTPTTSIVVDINPALELKVNKWNRIIKTAALNKDGEQMLASLNIKNKTLDEGLSMIVEEAENENFINESNKDNVNISLSITPLDKTSKTTETNKPSGDSPKKSSEDKTPRDGSEKLLDLPKFESKLKEKNLNAEINNKEVISNKDKNTNTNIPKNDIMDNEKDLTEEKIKYEKTKEKETNSKENPSKSVPNSGKPEKTNPVITPNSNNSNNSDNNLNKKNTQDKQTPNSKEEKKALPEWSNGKKKPETQLQNKGNAKEKNVSKDTGNSNKTYKNK